MKAMADISKGDLYTGRWLLRDMAAARVAKPVGAEPKCLTGSIGSKERGKPLVSMINLVI